MREHRKTESLPIRRARNLLVLGLLVLVGATGCPEEDPEENGEEVAVDTINEVLIIDRSVDEDIAQYHDGDHWHGQIVLDPDDEEHTSLGFEFYDEDGNEVDVPLGEDGFDYDIDIEDESLVTLDTHSDHFHLYGEEPGDTEVFFDFTRDGESFFDTDHDGLNLIVTDPEADIPLDEIYEVLIIDRSDDEPIADYHGGHWHGSIQLDADDDDHSSFGFEFRKDDHTEVDVPLGTDGFDYEVDIDDEGLVTLEAHSDHFYLTPEEVGDTDIYFDFTDDGDSFYDTQDEGLPLSVADGDVDMSIDHVEHFGLLDRNDDHEEFAYVDGDHWHGTDEIDLHVADDTSDYDTEAIGTDGAVAVSLGADVDYHNEDDDHFHLDWDATEYELEVEATDGADYVVLDNHGDHVHIIGADAGHAHVVFHIVDGDGDSVYETPEFDVDVHEANDD